MAKKKNPSLLQLSEEEKKKLRQEIEYFYREVRGEEIGIIHRDALLEIFMEHLAPVIYNKALDDVHKWSVMM